MWNRVEYGRILAFLVSRYYHHDYKEVLEGSGSIEKEESFACVIQECLFKYACS